MPKTDTRLPRELADRAPDHGQYATDDVHAYRTPIADDCKVGACSINNCLYPDCSPSFLARADRTDFIGKYDE